MVSLKTIAAVISASALLVAALAWWADSNSSSADLFSNQELRTSEKLSGPLTPEEDRIVNPITTNNMNAKAVITTSEGIIELELFTETMPVTTGNFIKLVNEGFYNGTKFHRVIDGFMIQGGDPNSKGPDQSRYGTGGPGYTIQDEFVAGDELTNSRGTIAMANTGQPNSGGSQFFINLVDNSFLDFDKPPLSSKHPVFGRIISGMDVVDKIAKVETSAGDVPLEPIVLESVVIE